MGRKTSRKGKNQKHTENLARVSWGLDFAGEGLVFGKTGAAALGTCLGPD